MCDPTLILAAVSMVVQNKNQRDASADARKSAQEAYEADKASREEARAETDRQARQQSYERNRESTADASRVRASAGETGLGGLGISLLEGENAFETGSDLAVIEANRSAAGRQFDRENDASRVGLHGRLRAAKGPGLLQAGLQIATESSEYANKTGKYRTGASTTKAAT